jgi:hypothetical protein
MVKKIKRPYKRIYLQKIKGPEKGLPSLIRQKFI